LVAYLYFDSSSNKINLRDLISSDLTDFRKQCDELEKSKGSKDSADEKLSPETLHEYLKARNKLLSTVNQGNQLHDLDVLLWGD
jgi:hypothetical protein